METADLNGGNAEVACESSNLETVEEQIEKQSEGEKPEETNEIEQEINGDTTDLSKSVTSPTRRTLRKTKANSTSNVEAVVESDAKPKMKGCKRKLSDPEMNSEESLDFTGFDSRYFDNSDTGNLVLQKLIAEVELTVGTKAKRGRPSRKSIAIDSKQDDILNDVREIMSAKEPEPMDVVNNIESDVPQPKFEETLSKSSVSTVNNSTPNVSAKSKANRPLTAITPSTPVGKPKVDLSNPAFLEPFKSGWKRELVHRGAGSEANLKKVADIYYITPQGKKIRSYKEISGHLTASDNLTVENFTFHKDTLGLNDPEKEIVRTARRGGPKDATPVGKTAVKKVAASPAAVTVAKKTPAKKAENLPAQVSTPVVAKSSPAKSVGRPPKNTPASQKIKPVKKTPLKKETKQKQLDQKQSSPAPVTESKENEFSPAISSPATKRNQQAIEKTVSPKAKRPLKRKQVQAETEQRQNFMVSVCAGYHALSKVFQYLKVQELLRVGRVCKMWRDLAAHPSLWKTVRMKNSQVTDWNGFAETLKKSGTQYLDLRKMIASGESEAMWRNFAAVIPRVNSLVKLEFCRCTEIGVEEVIKNCSQLEVLIALMIKCETLNLESLGNLKRCRELRLKSLGGMYLQDDLSSIKECTHLTYLSLTTIKDLGQKKLDALQFLVNLETLELGDCTDFPETFGKEALVKLNKLERLRLEKGQGSCSTFDILDGASKIESLSQLELVNFDVKNGFDKFLAKCTNIKRLLIIPTYISQSATTNNMVLAGVIELSQNLTHFVWGVTLELLRVTELFVDQCNQMNKTVSGDSIPVLKPVPCLKLIQDNVDDADSKKDDNKQASGSNPQVDILPMSQLQKLLLTALPKTRVKILKIPFNATWRQNISDTISQ